MTLFTHFSESASSSDFAARYLQYLSDLLQMLDTDVIASMIEAFESAAEQGNTIFFIGNGGSAATASHFAGDIAFNTRVPQSPDFKAICLSDNQAILTALANDEGYEKVFIRQLEVMLQPEDVVVALSVSGNSSNVVAAVQYANDLGALTIGLTGFDGGELRKLVDIGLHVPTSKGEYGPAEDVFQILDHLIYTYLRMKRLGRLTR